MPSARPRTPALVVSMSIGLVACGAHNAASQLGKAPDYDPKDQTKCGVEKSQARPLIVEWPSADRQELEGRVRQGVVAVSYHGCEMEVLDRCSVATGYRYQGTTRSQDKVVVRDEDDLYAKLPLGAAGLEGDLQQSGQLTVEMSLVGRYEAQKLSVSQSELQGDCSRATHFIYAVSVGAFDFYSGADATVGASIGVGGVGAGATSKASRKTLNSSGDPASCNVASPDDKAPPGQCGAVIRVEVVPLGAAATQTPTCPSGTQWDGSQCVGTRVVSNVQCPPGSSWNGAQCVGSAPPPVAPPPAAPPPTDPSAQQRQQQLQADQQQRMQQLQAIRAADLARQAQEQAGATAPFDRVAAAAALDSIAANLGACKRPDSPTGAGHIKVSFANDGTVQVSSVDPPYGGTATGGCIAGHFRTARIPAFSGAPMWVGKSFALQ